MTELAQPLPGGALPFAEKNTARYRLGVAVAATVVLSEVVLPAVCWRDNPTEIVADTSLPAPSAMSRCLVVPGLCHSDSRQIISEVRPLLPSQPLDGFSYANRGLTAASVGQALAKYYERHYEPGKSSQSLLVHSMGLPLFLKGAEWCVRNGHYVPPVDAMAAFCSPPTAREVYGAQMLHGLAASRYRGGMLWKLGFDFSNLWFDNGLTAVGAYRALRGTMKEAFSGYSPRLGTSKFRLLAATRNGYDESTLRALFTRDSHIYHCADPADGVIDIAASRTALRALLEPCGATVIDVDMPETGHGGVASMNSYLGQTALCTTK